MLFFTLLFLAQVLVSALAAPVVTERAGGGVTAALASAVSSFTPYIQFARAAYCTNGASVWNCGAACKAISDFQIYAGGGDGAATPSWFVGWSPSLNSIVVAHEGTDPTNFLSLVNDIDWVPNKMDQAYFKGISSAIQVHGGFQDTFKRSASSILAAVKKVMAAKSSSKVTLVGHSLGGALALLDTIYLKIQIPSITTKTVTLGGPRAGNPAFAAYLNSFDLTRITHRQDPIPIVPGRLMGFAHPQGMRLDASGNSWYNCPGSDNTDGRCSTGAVANIFVGDIFDHLGSYNNLFVGSIHC
ncbi:hypothetical protein M407DRAFT_13580 [Tulasnella calospora MUT 4182]|uniref:Fungal lipase-type domain-containing protein n=1 Tax=Tulasnella calospora MUT 4182 TaxID=1051891 RepID=A0A0C3MKB0_9AGAM|nr:hypothetical protein M407DRAFT_13580 [Tulasnella calospora MUT 4182]